MQGTFNDLPKVFRDGNMRVPGIGGRGIDSGWVQAGEQASELGLPRELTGNRRNRVFSYQRYLAILGEGTEPL